MYASLIQTGAWTEFHPALLWIALLVAVVGLGYLAFHKEQ